MFQKCLVAMVLFCAVLFAEHVRWYGNYSKALKAAKLQHKPLVILVLKNDNGDIVKDFFIDKKYIKTINNHTIPIMINIQTNSAYPIEMYWTNRYPTLFFVDYKNEIFLTKPIYGKNITQKRIKEAIKTALNKCS